MSVFGKIKEWTEGSRSCFCENLYIGHVPLYGLLRDVLSNIAFKEDYAASLKKLGEQGIVVYALKDRSRLNTLILYDLALRQGIPRPAYAFDVNMVLWQPLSKVMGTFFTFLRRLASPRFRAEMEGVHGLQEQVARGEHVIIHLGSSEFFENEAVEDALTRLIEVSAQVQRPIFIVPVLITYGRRREKEHENYFNILFGQTENTGAIRRLITFIRYAGKIMIIPTEPVDVAAYAGRYGNLGKEELVRRLRAELIESIDVERTAMLGPMLKSRREIMGMVLKDPAFEKAVGEMAASGKKDSEGLMKDARRYLNEIAADYEESFISFFYRILTWLWNNIYDGVVIDREGMVRIRNISKKMPFVIIPCHRSHIDYLLIHYLFYENHIQLPFIAAGNNMAFGPFGYIFRNCGAFFLRRSFRGNPLYGEVFTQYIRTLIREGLPLEFFIEGGRSRTGKMVMPKYGLLSMVIDAYQQDTAKDFAAIPVYIGYDRVIEEKSYLQELGGVPKKAETTADVIKSSRVLRKRYGRVYVNIGEPIYFKSYLESLEKPVPDMTVEERQSLYRKIGYEIVMSINRVSVVTPFALISAGLLSHDRRGISHDELKEILDEFYEYLVSRNVSLAVTFANRDKSIGDALGMFDEAGFISRMGADEEEDADIDETVYCLEDEKRLNLEYYKNTILHYFLPLSFVSTSMLSHPADVISLGRIMEDYQFLKRLFRNEFIFDDHSDDAREVNEALGYLHDKGMIVLRTQGEGAGLEVRGRGRAYLQHFAGLVENYLESYWVVIRGCAYLRKGPRSERDWMKKLQKLGTKMHQKGEIRRAEALSQGNYENCIKFLEDQGVFDVSENPDKKDRKEAKLYALREDRTTLDTIRKRTFNYLQ